MFFYSLRKRWMEYLKHELILKDYFDR